MYIYLYIYKRMCSVKVFGFNYDLYSVNKLTSF